MNLMPEPVTSLFKAIADSVGSLSLFADDGPDGGLGVLMSGLAGIAAALAVAIRWRCISEAAIAARVT